MGRPLKEIDPAAVKLLAQAFCTNEEIAAQLGCSADTLTRRFAEPLNAGRNSAKASLRGKQFRVAMEGNPALLIWLGKQYLDQRDKTDTNLTTNVDDRISELLESMASAR